MFVCMCACMCVHIYAKYTVSTQTYFITVKALIICIDEFDAYISKLIFPYTLPRSFPQSLHTQSVLQKKG